MKTVISQQGDTLDKICHRHYGETRSITEKVYEQNPGLAKYGLLLPEGLEIRLPDVTPTAIVKVVKLWD